jgi:hypothetical protein
MTEVIPTRSEIPLEATRSRSERRRDVTAKYLKGQMKKQAETVSILSLIGTENVLVTNQAIRVPDGRVFYNLPSQSACCL